MTSVRVKFEVPKGLTKALKGLDNSGVSKIFGKALPRWGFKIQEQATEKHLRGPRPQKLFPRTGAGIRSVRVNVNRSPFTVDVGSDLAYMAYWELGPGKVAFSKAPAIAHSRQKGYPTFGTNPKPRPWLQPGVEQAQKFFDAILFQEMAKQTGATQ